MPPRKDHPDIPNIKTEHRPIANFKPTGTAAFVSGPSDKVAGRLKIDLTSGGFSLKGEIDVLNCSELKQQ